MSVVKTTTGFPGGTVGKNPPAKRGDVDFIPGWGRSPGEGNGNPLPYSCLENSMDIGVSWATIHGVTKSQTERLTLSLSKEGLVMWVNYLQTLSFFLLQLLLLGRILTACPMCCMTMCVCSYYHFST